MIRGCDAGSVGASLAMALARNPVRVFATSTTLTAMSGLVNYPNITAMAMDTTSLSEHNTTTDILKTLLNGETLNVLEACRYVLRSTIVSGTHQQ